MNKIKELIKDNRYTVIALIIFVFLIFLGFAVYRFLFPNIGSPVYGNRLDGIKDVEITSDQKETIEKKIKGNKIVTTVSSYLKGRIYNVIIEVNDGTKSSDAKALSKIIKDNFEEKQLDYFDIQVFITNKNEKASGYPIIGYLNKESDVFSYSEGN